MKKFVCIHGHFYQPPRENPWLNEVEMQDSAYPYHDWNERITAECYSRNAASRILDGEDRIIDIINNYSWISFNFGPTLLEWMERKAPYVYEQILQADKDSMEHFNGHGSALAQVYNHMIMPLANERDKQTQVKWGIRDFELRFGRLPEGMWCGETAVDTATLEVLAEHGIKFTILSPYQAKSVRKIGDEAWKDVTGAKVDPRMPYLCKLPSGKEISIFYYDGPISQGIAFENLLESGETFASRLTGHFSKNDKSELMNIATDGETYGHHHRFGEMALSYAIHHIQTTGLAELTIYGEYLENNPPQFETRMHENSSWSCAHGVERWRSNCGCNTGGNNWHQKWREPLRNAFDWLRELLIPFYENEMKNFSDDPWAVRNNYINVIHNRDFDFVSNFIKENTNRELNTDEQTRFLKLLEMQYHAMLMYTSCGWFFDEVTGIETMQDIFYATRALQLAEELSGEKYEKQFVQMLEKAPSNLPEHKNAGVAYKKFVKNIKIDLLRVGGHYAVSSLFTDYPEESKLYSYTAKSEHYEEFEAGKQKLDIGRALIKSEITWEEKMVTFAILYLGEHNLFGGVREFHDQKLFDQMRDQLVNSFQNGKTIEMIMMIDNHFGTHNYSLWHLFRDEQKKILNQVLESGIYDVEAIFQQIYENNYPLIQAVNSMKATLPLPYKLVVNFIVNTRLKDILDSRDVSPKRVQRVIDEVKQFNVDIDEVTLSFNANRRISKVFRKINKNPNDINRLGNAVELLTVVKQLPINPDLWEAQNVVFKLQKEMYDNIKASADNGDSDSVKWLEKIDALSEILNINM